MSRRFSARGGAERGDSVFNGLTALGGGDEIVFIHDGARPLVGAENIVRLSDAARADGAAVLAARVTDTIKKVPNDTFSLRSRMLEDLDRPSSMGDANSAGFPYRSNQGRIRKSFGLGMKVTDDHRRGKRFWNRRDQ